MTTQHTNKTQSPFTSLSLTFSHDYSNRIVINSDEEV